MPTTPVAFYSSLIDEEIRRLACSSIRDGSSIEWCSIKKMLDFKTKNFFKIKTKMNNKIHHIIIHNKKVKIK